MPADVGETWASLGRQPAQGGIGYQQGVRLLVREKLNIGGHVRQEPAMRVVGAHDNRVSDNILVHGGIEPRLVLDHGAEKFLGWKSIDCETRLLPWPDLTDVRLVDGSPNLQALEVFWRSERGWEHSGWQPPSGRRSPAIDDDALHRRTNRRVTEVGLGFAQDGPA